MATWDPDVEMTLEWAHALISRQFPAFEDLSPSTLGRGWDNVCYLYPDGTVFRLPTRKMGGQLMVTELAVLPQLRNLPLPIPDIRFAGQPEGDYPYSFMGYQQLEGTTSDRVFLSEEVQLSAAEVLGQFLHALNHHTVPSGAPTSNFGPDRLASMIRLRYEALGTVSAADKEWCEHVLRRAEVWLKEVTAEEVRTLCHGDLYPRHVLIGANKVTGVIDWGDVQIGHPAQDLSIAYTMFDQVAQSQFWAAYGGDPPQNWHRLAQLKATVYAFALIAYGLDIDDQDMAQLARLIGQRLLNAS